MLGGVVDQDRLPWLEGRGAPVAREPHRRQADDDLRQRDRAVDDCPHVDGAGQHQRGAPDPITFNQIRIKPRLPLVASHRHQLAELHLGDAALPVHRAADLRTGDHAIDISRCREQLAVQTVGTQREHARPQRRARRTEEAVGNARVTDTRQQRLDLHAVGATGQPLGQAHHASGVVDATGVDTRPGQRVDGVVQAATAVHVGPVTEAEPDAARHDAVADGRCQLQGHRRQWQRFFGRFRTSTGQRPAN